MTTPQQPRQTLIDDMLAIRQWSQPPPSIDRAEVDSINVIFGDGANVIPTGIQASVVAHFRARITGGFLYEFDGITGSINVTIAKAQYSTGGPPTFTGITASSPLVISSARYGENLTLTGWTLDINRGDVLRFSVASVTSLHRVLCALRIRRLEP